MQTLRFGIVGTGTIAHRFAEAVRNVRGVELTAVASRTKERGDGFAKEYDIPHVFVGYETMAQSDAIDAAYIAVPHSGHVTCTCMMLRGGKHVLCEKPMAVTAAEGEQMFRTAKENGVFLMEAMWARHVPGTLKMLELVRRGTLGDILGVEGKFCYTMDEDEMDHHVFRPEHGGGALLDVGVYGLHFALWYLGRDVIATDVRSALYRGVDAHTCMLLQYADGAIADLSAAILLRKPNEGFVYGSKGYAYLPRFYAPQRIELHLHGKDAQTIETPYAGNGFEEQIAHMRDCVRQGVTESPLVPAADTLYVLRQMDSIRRKIGVVYPQDTAAASAPPKNLAAQ